MLESLEPRFALATITVTTANDVVNGGDGVISLREAVTAANLAGPDTINFAAGLNGETITLTLGELSLTDAGSATTITGPGASNLSISGNKASRIFNVSGGKAGQPVSISGLTLKNGKSDVVLDAGGAIINTGTLEISGVTLTDNAATAGRGGAIWTNSSLKIQDSVITKNTATASGGGLLFLVGSTVEITNTTISDNSGTHGGGFAAATTVTISNSTISGNTATGAPGGGGIFSYFGNVNITNSTISGNTAAAGPGGGIFRGNDVPSVTTFTMTNSTVTANRSATPGGGLVANGTENIKNTLIAGNFLGLAGSTPDDVAGTIETSGNNLIGDAATAGGLTNGVNNNIVGVADPLLGPLADSGGLTKTHALLAGSPAINAGDNLNIPVGVTTDQRGLLFSRTSGTVDIGAVERQTLFGGPFAVTVDTASDVNDGDLSLGNLSLREAIGLANGSIGPNTITFDTAGVFATPQTITLSGTELAVVDDLTLTGTGANRLTINANNLSRVFSIDDGRQAQASTVALNGLTLSGGNVTGNGGGVFSRETLTVSDSVITGNAATGLGGGIYSRVGIQTITTLTFQRSTISGNTAATGAGMYTHTGGFAGVSTISNSTISGNIATGTGGGIDSRTVNGAVIIQNSTISSNQAATGGGINSSPIGGTGTTTIRSTIVAGNTATTTAPDLRVTGNVHSVTSSLIGIDTGSGLAPAAVPDINGNLVGTAGTPINPLLGALADNGGGTPTRALLANSPALNRGSNLGGLASDQRGAPFVRANGVVDMGAFETQSLNLVVDIATDEDDGNFAAGDLSLREAVRLANVNAEADNISFAPGINDLVLTIGSLVLSDTNQTSIEGGSGVQVRRSSAGATPNFAVFQVNPNGKAALTALTISNGRGSNGGGIQNNFGKVIVANSTIRDNTNFTVNSNGAGIENNQGTVTVIGSTISNNTALQVGGGLNNFQGTMTIINSTISGNSAAVSGGGVISQAGTLTITNSTITNNKSVNDTIGGGLRSIGGGLTTLNNTIVAENFRANGATRDDVGGPVVGASSNNLIGDGTGLTGITNGNQGNQIGTAAAPLFPGLGPLANNGGPTQTHALFFGSLAIDAGNNANIPVGVVNDQRGVPFNRTSGTVDIGAFEHQGGVITTQVLQAGKKATDLQLIVTGDGDLNRLTVDLGTGGVKNSLKLTPSPGTVIVGPTDFTGITKGVTVNLLGESDMITVNGSKVAGPIALNLADGDDSYVLSASKTKFALADSSGFDLIDFANQTKGAKLDLAKQGTKKQGMGNGNTTTLNGQWEFINGSPFNDNFKGDEFANFLNGNAGNDTIDGRDGDDQVTGDAGKDKLKGGGGNDLVLGGTENDKMDGGPGNDILFGGAGNDSLKGGDGDDILLGEADNDSLTAGKGFDLLIGGLGIDKLTGARAGNSLMIGGSTNFDVDFAALLAIRDEWARTTAPSDLQSRVNNLETTGVGTGNTVKLLVTVPAAPLVDTVIDDLVKDTIKTSGVDNWIFTFATDKHTGKKPGGKISPA